MINAFLWKPSGEVTESQDVHVIQEALSKNGLKVWLDLQDASETELEQLELLFKFDPRTIKSVRELVGIPKIDTYENYIFLILHRAFYRFETEECEMREFEVYFSDRFIVTIHKAYL